MRSNSPNFFVRTVLRKILAGILASLVTCAHHEAASGNELVLLDLPFGGFTYTFDDFIEAPEADGIRITDPINGWGGAALEIGGADYSAYAAGHLVVEFYAGVANANDVFVIEIVDEDGNKGKWTFISTGDLPGVPQQLVATTSLADPHQTIGGPLDLTRIHRWQILGEFESAAPVDLVFQKIAISNAITPPPPYSGYQPSAAWRQAAQAAIEDMRRSRLRVNVVDQSGRPIQRAQVHQQMQRHLFPFGTSLDGNKISNGDPAHALYRQKTVEYFTRATPANSLKWPNWEGEEGPYTNRATALATIAWLRAQGLEVRGHNILWPGIEETPDRISQLLQQVPLSATQQQQLRDEVAARITDVVSANAGQLVAWDVVNEPRNDHQLMSALDEGNAAIVDWLAQVRAADPSALLAVNENQILASSGAVDTHRLAALLALIDLLQAENAPLDCIGIEGHFTTGTLTGPEQVWQILDLVAQRGLPVEITEFDFETADDLLQAEFTRDFLTAAFAHPSIIGFTFWGFAEDYHWRPDAALFRSDWSIKPNGQAFLDLVFGEWWSDIQSLTNSNGWSNQWVFKGDYQLSVTFGEHTVTQPTSTSRRVEKRTVVLPMLLGDYDRDGDIDTHDRTFALNSRGQHVPPGTGADGTGDGRINRFDLYLLRDIRAELAADQ